MQRIEGTTRVGHGSKLDLTSRFGVYTALCSCKNTSISSDFTTENRRYTHFIASGRNFEVDSCTNIVSLPGGKNEISPLFTTRAFFLFSALFRAYSCAIVRPPIHLHRKHTADRRVEEAHADAAAAGPLG